MKEKSQALEHFHLFAVHRFTPSFIIRGEKPSISSIRQSSASIVQFTFLMVNSLFKPMCMAYACILPIPLAFTRILVFYIIHDEANVTFEKLMPFHVSSPPSKFFMR